MCRQQNLGLNIKNTSAKYIGTNILYKYQYFVFLINSENFNVKFILFCFNFLNLVHTLQTLRYVQLCTKQVNQHYVFY